MRFLLKQTESKVKDKDLTPRRPQKQEREHMRVLEHIWLESQ